MMKMTRAISMIVIAVAACATQQHAPTVPRPRVIPHAQWQAQPPLGYAADATRRNIGASRSLAFHDFRIDVLSTPVDSTGAAQVDVVRLRLSHERTTEERTVQEGVAFNWRGFHVAVVAIYGPQELGAGLVALGRRGSPCNGRRAQHRRGDPGDNYPLVG